MKYPDNFIKNAHLNIWLSTENDISFDYSDGTEAENYIEKSLKQVSDLSSSSIELANLIYDWASEYHFSPKRANLFRLLNLNHYNSVLELGCGCGAITRYLGENLPQVIGVEGSLKRAEIAALRCRNLDNVEIICEQFQNLEFSEKFDLITLIGVLEYSGKYIDNEDPYQAVLEIVKSNLSEDGVLVLAIENKLGLKYFAGCSEDHSGVIFDGIEGYSSGSKIETFGKKELINLLDLSGLSHHTFLYPFPDYKIPDVILNMDSSHNRFNSYHKWLFPGQFRDYVGKKIELFQEFLALKQLEKNGLLADLSNSFLVIASNKPENIKKILDPDTLIWKYNVTRLPEFMTSVKLRQQINSSQDLQQLYIEREAIHPDLFNNKKSKSLEINCHIKEKQGFIQGDLLIELILASLRHKKNIDQLQNYLRKWHMFLNEQSKIVNCEPNNLPSVFWDCTPWNLIVLENDELFYIDQEWEIKETLSIDYIIFRGLLYLYTSFHVWIKSSLKLPDKGIVAFIDYAYNLIEVKVTEDQINHFFKKEFYLQKLISGQTSEFEGFAKYIESTKLDENKPIYQLFNQTHSQLEQTHSQLEQCQAELQKTRSIVFAMETSKFWQMRKIWFKIKSIFINQSSS